MAGMDQKEQAETWALPAKQSGKAYAVLPLDSLPDPDEAEEARGKEEY